MKFKELAGTSAPEGESSARIRGRVVRARERQRGRLRGEGAFSNAQMSPRLIRKYCRVGAGGERLLEQALTRLGLSARAYDRTLKALERRRGRRRSRALLVWGGCSPDPP